MNLTKKFAHVLAAGSLLLMMSCGDSLLLDVNDNQEIIDGGTTMATSVDQAAGMLLTAQQKVHDIEPHQYQYQFNLHIDNYCGYMCLPQNFDGRQPSTYYINKDFAGGPRGSFFNTSAQALPVMRSAEQLGIAEIGAMARILYSLSAEEMADIYGPFPWSDYKEEKQDPPLTYYSVKDIYDSIFVELDKAVVVLKNFSNTTSEHQDSINKILNSGYDRVCGGSVKNWIKFANTLRLRMAMHISVVAPEKAEAEATKAIKTDGGVLEFASDKDIAYDKSLDGGSNPLAFISSSWKDTRLNASFENLLKSMESPLLEKWFDKNGADITDDKGNVTLTSGSDYIGIRSGLTMTPRDNNNKYINFSAINTTYSSRPVYLMKVSEAQFLLAEATLRWGEDLTGAPAMIWYENGILQALIDEKIPVDAQDKYFELEEAKDLNYTDYYDAQNNTDGLFHKQEKKIGVAWDEGDDNETKLEKIITQKYIANFPQSIEAWVDLRRTGYPRIYSVTDDDGDGSIVQGEIIRRIPYIINDDSDRSDVTNSAVPLLGGPDYQGTRLWWDTGSNW